MERDTFLNPYYIYTIYFNSHAHVERDEKATLILKDSKISTHTLTWSVTHPGCRCTQETLYFNSHAHVERDRTSLSQDHHTGHFNSHAHVERDLLSGVFNVTRVISTHTLTWSVTGLTDDDISDEFDFNSHAHVERDKVVRAQDYLGEISTHTLTWSVTYLTTQL